MENWTDTMTLKDYLSILLPVIAGLLGIAFTGWWQIRALTKKFNMEGGSQKTKGELEIQNIEIATRASAYALELQKTIDSQAATIKAQDERIVSLENEVQTVTDELEKEKKKNELQDQKIIEQDKIIDQLKSVIKRSKNAHTRSTD